MTYPPGLGARLVVGQDPPGGEVEGIIFVWFLSRRLMMHRVEPGPAAGRGKTVNEQARRTGVNLRGTGPEHTLVVFDLLVRDSRVISYTPRRWPNATR